MNTETQITEEVREQIILAAHKGQADAGKPDYFKKKVTECEGVYVDPVAYLVSHALRCDDVDSVINDLEFFISEATRALNEIKKLPKE